VTRKEERKDRYYKKQKSKKKERKRYKKGKVSFTKKEEKNIDWLSNV